MMLREKASPSLAGELRMKQHTVFRGTKFVRLRCKFLGAYLHCSGDADSYIVTLDGDPHRRALVDGGKRVVKDVELRSHGEVRRWREDVRLYEPAEVHALLRDVGLTIESRHGAFDSGAFDAESPRLLVRARR